jgi:hypothetical protein
MGFASAKTIPDLGAAVVLRIIAPIPQKASLFATDKMLKVFLLLDWK